MSKRTKASKKRLNNLLLILLLTAVLLVMSTYAWFTANRTVNIDALDVRVSTSSGLQISTNGEDWKTVIDKDDIVNAHQKYTAANNQVPAIMAPVSTDGTLRADTGHTGEMKMFYGIINTDLDASHSTYGKYMLTSQLQTDRPSNEVTDEELTNNEYAKGYYIAFDVFLRDDLPSQNLYMSGSVVEEKLDPSADPKQLENAARVAIVKGDNTANSDNVTAVRGLTTNGGTVMIWEPNYDTHSTHGIDNAALYGRTGVLQVNNAQLPYDGVSQSFTTGVELYGAANASTNPTLFATVTPTWATKKADLPSLAMPDSTKVSGNALSAGVTRYRIYMWVEGQDVDCENYASGTGLKYSLSFSLDPYSVNP